MSLCRCAHTGLRVSVYVHVHTHAPFYCQQSDTGKALAIPTSLHFQICQQAVLLAPRPNLLAQVPLTLSWPMVFHSTHAFFESVCWFVLAERPRCFLHSTGTRTVFV